MKIKVCGLDPSLRHWGIAVGEYDTDSGLVIIHNVDVVIPVLSKGKQVRQNSLDLESAKQLCKATVTAVEGARAIFVEVPIGSQSARAMASYGVCCGILGALRAMGTQFHEVTPTEVKVAGPGYKNATKQDMIQWATTKHPEANWPTYPEHGVLKISEAKAEHMADATAAIYAGIACNTFQQMKLFL